MKYKLKPARQKNRQEPTIYTGLYEIFPIFEAAFMIEEVNLEMEYY